MNKNSILKSLKKLRTKHYVMISAAAILLATVFAVQTTFAWMISSDSKNNQIGIMQYLFSHQIQETFNPPAAGTHLTGGDIVVKTTSVKNDGDINSFVRVRTFPVLTTPDGEIQMKAQFGKQLRYINLNDSDWKDGGDGWFYYLHSLAPGTSTQPLFDKVELEKDIVTDFNAVLTVTLIAETVETRNTHYREAWWSSPAEVNTGPHGVIDEILRGLAQ